MPNCFPDRRGSVYLSDRRVSGVDSRQQFTFALEVFDDTCKLKLQAMKVIFNQKYFVAETA